MSTTALVRHEPLPLIQTSSVPSARRTELRLRQAERLAARSRTFAAASLTGLCGLFSALYAGGAFLLAGLAPGWLVACLAAGAFLLLSATLCMATRGVQCVREWRSLAPPERLVLEAGAEQALYDAAFRLNGGVIAWNEAVQLAVDDAALVKDLSSVRSRLLTELEGFHDRLRRFR